MAMTKIGMVVAMRKEVLPFLEESGAKWTTEQVGNYTITYFCLKNKEVYLIESGIGEIYAAGATQLLISRYGVDAVINFGVSGSLIEEVGVLNTVLVEGIVHYDFDLSPIDNVSVGQYPGFADVVIPCDKYLLGLAKELRPNTQSVICASADKFVADEGQKETLHTAYGASICEMECAGVALTAINNGIPFLIIKAISDGKGGAEDYKAMVQKACQSYISFVYEILDRI